LGFNRPTLRLPAVEANKHTVKVVLENGMPVIGALVSIPKPEPVYGFGCLESKTIQIWVDAYFDDEDNFVDGHYVNNEYCIRQGETIIDYEGGAVIDSTVVVNGFSFTSQVGPYEGVTDINGTVVISGFFAEPIDATVIYDDSVITQEQVVPLATAYTRVELEFIPFVSIETPTVTASPNQLVPVTVSINDAQVSPAGFSRASVTFHAAAKKGIKVSLVAPKGAPKTKCKAKLTGTTDSRGRMTFYVCATKSGVYTVKGAGAASVSTVRLQVKGTAPMPVRTVVAKSPSIGQASLSWASPIFDGKSAIKNYKLVASAKGKKTITKMVSASTKKVVIAGLSNGTTYTVSITAVNAKGQSDPVTVKVPVA
jgi:hypothetical protein